MEGVCRRCFERVTLCRSHIIPEGAFRPVYDEKRAALNLDSEGSAGRVVQQGVWEYMFCRDCEDFFESLETPFQRFWKHPNTFPARLDKPAIRVPGVDYENIKRFLLSVLWRAHVSKRSEYAGVDLGPHAHRIDQLLRSADAIPADRYPIFGYALKSIDTGGADFKVLVTPARCRIDGHQGYMVAFLGVGWMIMVTSHPVSLPRSCLLESHKPLLMPVIRTSEFGPVMQIIRDRSADDA
jgi:hypothetical protein